MSEAGPFALLRGSNNPMRGIVGARSACHRSVSSVTTVRGVVPVDPRNTAYSRGCATASSLRCDQCPVATRPSAGYGSFLVTVGLPCVAPAPTVATLSVVSHARTAPWVCTRGWNSDRMARMPQRLWGGPCVPSRMDRAICPRSLDKTSVQREQSRAQRLRHARVRGPAANLYEKR